jgi:hypothetical protein
MSKQAIIVYEYQDTLLNVNEISRFVGVRPVLIRKLFKLGLINPQRETPDLLFEGTVISRIDKILRLNNDLGVNFLGCGLVLDLLDKIENLEKKLLYYEMKHHQ